MSNGRGQLSFHRMRGSHLDKTHKELFYLFKFGLFLGPSPSEAFQTGDQGGGGGDRRKEDSFFHQGIQSKLCIWKSGELNFFFVPSTTQKESCGESGGTTKSEGLPQMKFLRSVGFHFPCS